MLGVKAVLGGVGVVVEFGGVDAGVTDGATAVDPVVVDLDAFADSGVFAGTDGSARQAAEYETRINAP